MAQYEWPAGISERRKDVMAKLIWTIQLAGGYRSEDGSATALVRDALVAHGVTFSGTYMNAMLNNIDRGGQFGRFIKRDMRGKRTYAILPVRDPARDPFPPNPFERQTPRVAAAAARAASVTHAVDEIEDAEIIDVEEPAGTVAVIDTGDIQVDVPDRLLYVISVLQECIGDLAAQPLRGVGDYIQGQLGAVDRLIDENRQLRDALAERERTILTLRRALGDTAAGQRANGLRS